MACQGGKTPTVGEVKAMIGSGEVKAGASPESGGVAGLKARIAEKTAVGVAQVMDDAEALLTATLLALEPYRQGKRIVVKDTQRPFIHPARLLRERLEWLTWLAVPAPAGSGEGAIHHQPLVRDDHWSKLHRTLDDLGGYEDWPKAAEVGTWLSETVVPQLSWLLGERAKKSFAILEKRVAEAEAQRMKAEKDKARAKAREKQDRLKAKRGMLMALNQAAPATQPTAAEA